MSDYQHMFYLTRTVAVNAVIFYHPKIRHTVKNLYCGVVNGFTLKLPVVILVVLREFVSC